MAITMATSRGQVSHHAGLSAEQCVERHYERQGYRVACRRWRGAGRGAGGEIDLIARDGDGVVFIEVKKSRSFARAAERVSQRQMRRIYASAEQFLEREPKGQLTNARFDVALVDGRGGLEIIENAFGHC
jgi:putative endonuclease